MAYTKQVWSEDPADDTPLSAQRLNHMEDGIAGAHESSAIEDGSVTTPKLADSAVTNAKIANLAVDSAKLAGSAVTTAKIGDLQVTNAKIGSGAVTSSKIGSNAVTGTELASNAVSATHINLNAVTEDKIANGAVATSKLASSAVGTLNINNLAVTGAKIANSTIGGDKISLPITLHNSTTGYNDILGLSKPTSTWNFGVDETSGDLRIREGGTTRFVVNSGGGGQLALSGSNIWHSGNLNTNDFAEVVTSREDILSTRHFPNTTYTQIMSVTPGRTGMWLALVSVDVFLTASTIFVGEVRRSTTAQTGALVFQGPGRTTIMNVYLVQVTGTTQTINFRASTTNTLGTREVLENQSRIVAYWLHP